MEDHEVVRKGKDRTLPGFESKETKFSPFFFIQAADTQLGMIDTWGENGSSGEKYPYVKWDREMDLCRQTVDLLNSMKPKPAFFIVCGDLVDAFPEKWPEIRAQQEKDFFKVFKELDPTIPLICVCGNHDVGEFFLEVPDQN